MMGVLSRFASAIRQPFIGEKRSQSQNRFLRDNRSGTLRNRNVILRSSRDDIRASWMRSAAYATDIMQNSGKLSGAATQVISDTVGNGLIVIPQPDLTGLGYDEKERNELISLMRKEYERWAKNNRECDFRGKLTMKKMSAISCRWDMGYGETIAVTEYFTPEQRARYGLRYGTKLMMIPPPQLVQDSDPMIGLYQGVISDENERPSHYRFRRSIGGQVEKYDWPANDLEGRPLIAHLFDPLDATDERGISKLAPAIRKHIASDDLDEATLQTAILQTLFVASLTSEMPSEQAFEAITTLKREAGEEGVAVYDAFMNNFADQIEGSEDDFYLGPQPQINSLKLGESLKIDGAKTPGADYLPFARSLDRATARALGITYAAYSMDNSDANYASINMDGATIWPVVENRRSYAVEPLCGLGYDHLMDECFGRGLIPLKGGYEAFRANRDNILKKSWLGPNRPVGDDYKAARASNERLKGMHSTVGNECLRTGMERDAMFEEMLKEHLWFKSHGMRSPFEEQSSVQPIDAMAQSLEAELDEDDKPNAN